MKTTQEAILEKHNSHQVEIRPGKGHHPAQYYCVECNKWISWISKKDLEILQKGGFFNV